MSVTHLGERGTAHISAAEAFNNGNGWVEAQLVHSWCGTQMTNDGYTAASGSPPNSAPLGQFLKNGKTISHGVSKPNRRDAPQ